LPFRNIYEDARYADAYARLEFPGTYALAFRDLPEIFAAHVRGTRAMDFGCGAGRSTRFLVRCGFDAIGVDISEDMVRQARQLDPEGDYRVIGDGGFGALPGGGFDLVFSAFTFDNVPTAERKARLLRGLRGLLAPGDAAGSGRRSEGRRGREENGHLGGPQPGGRLVNLVSSPDIYVNEWVSFSTRDFPENRQARSGEVVRIVNTAVADPRPVEDILWTDEAWQEVYAAAGLVQLEARRPLARKGEPGGWLSETTVAPWVIYVLGAATS
jgi:SAM-dependent methyltransferase